MKCFTRKLYEKYKSHNLTKKTFYDFKHNITTYLSPKQIMNLKCKQNDILNYKHTKHINSYSKNIIQKYSYKPRQMKSILSNIMKHIKPVKETLFINDTEEFYSITTNYPTYYYKNNNNTYVVLDVNKLSKGFDYFKIGTIELNNEYICFNVDFIGNRIYHLFLKHIYSDEIIELNTHVTKKKMFSVHETLNQTRNSDFFIWLEDDIVYTINDSAYNTNKTYIYNIFTHKNKLIYKNHNTFIEVKKI